MSEVLASFHADPYPDNLLVLAEAVFYHSVRENKADNANTGMVEQLNEELSEAMHKDPPILARSDLVSGWWVMGLQISFDKRPRSEVNLFTTPTPDCMSYVDSQNEKPNSATIPEDSVETLTPELSRG